MFNPEYESEILNLPLPFSQALQIEILCDYIEKNCATHPQQVRNMMIALTRMRREFFKSTEAINKCLLHLEGCLPELEMTEEKLKESKGENHAVTYR